MEVSLTRSQRPFMEIRRLGPPPRSPEQVVRLIRTVALFCPMSETRMAGAPQFVLRDGISVHHNHSSPDDRPQTRIAWSR